MKKILYNARIHTQDDDQPIASAMVVDDGKIIAVGDDDILHKFSNFDKEDLQKRSILPGLTDAHIHLQQYAMNLQSVDCETDTIGECLERVAARVNKTPKGNWVLGHGWNQNRWEAGFGTAEMLDVVAPDHPVYLTAKSLHAGWTNTQALRLAGIEASTPDPTFGKIMHDHQGKPNGILLEDATLLVSRVIPKPNHQELVRIIKEAQMELWKMGITGIHDFDGFSCYLALKDMLDHGELNLRVVKSIPHDELDKAIKLGFYSGYGGEMLRIGSLKLFADGALGPHTAAMIEPYIDDPSNYGILNLDREQINEIGCKAVKKGISLAIHAIGDKAVNEVLEGFVLLRKYEEENKLEHLRHRIEHVQLIHSNDQVRLGELDLIASMQPIHATSDIEMVEKYWGKRDSFAYGWRTQLNHQVMLAFGSDAPVESPNPFLGLHAAVTRRRANGFPGNQGWQPEQRLTLEEAWRSFSIVPAYAAGMEDKLGKVKAGYLADLLVLNEDPFNLDPGELVDLRPNSTMVNGELVWREN